LTGKTMELGELPIKRRQGEKKQKKVKGKSKRRKAKQNE
jgi:hypothetical protein